VFKNSAGRRKIRRFRQFLKNSGKLVKFGKNWSKRTVDDEGTVKIRNTEICLVSPINRLFFLKIGVVIFGRILTETGLFLSKIGK
jgi:hypothetical protein